MNILFVLYNDFTANSAAHVHSLANELTAMGHDCCVAVPGSKWTISNLGTVRFTAIDFADFFDGFQFADGRRPDMIHAWTPREVVRSFCEEVRKLHPCRLVVHMEDNEWHLVSCLVSKPWNVLRLLPLEELDQVIPRALSHPVRGYEFLAEADALTIIIDRLAEIVPRGKRMLELWPSAPVEYFYARPKVAAARRALGIPLNSTVLVYTGNIHGVNAHEMRSLYLAVALLNRGGHATTLVHAGREYYDFLGPQENWARRFAIELGLVGHREIPELLALADVLVQPGKADDFNDYRFPSKLPEYFSVGRPVILPRSNIARHMEHRKHAFILSEANGVSIAAAVREIISDSSLYDSLACGALEFFTERLSWKRSAESLAEFYAEVHAASQAAGHW